VRHDGVPADRIVLTGNTIVEAILDILPDETTARQARCTSRPPNVPRPGPGPCLAISAGR
jgi:hypothetical protein